MAYWKWNFIFTAIDLTCLLPIIIYLSTKFSQTSSVFRLMPARAHHCRPFSFIFFCWPSTWFFVVGFFFYYWNVYMKLMINYAHIKKLLIHEFRKNHCLRDDTTTVKFIHQLRFGQVVFRYLHIYGNKIMPSFTYANHLICS